MVYCSLADLVLILHLSFIVFVVAGGLLALRWRWAPVVHLPAALWGVFVEVSGRVCPLTFLENALRHASDASERSTGFIEHYLVPVLYPSALSPPVQLVLAGVVVLANGLIYSAVWWRHRNAGKKPADPRQRGNP